MVSYDVLHHIPEDMGCSVGEYNMNALERALTNKMRIRKCETLEQEKKQRKVRKRRRKGRDSEQAVDEEGKTYEAGAI